MTRFIAIASGKGGVGKTTTAINLGTALNEFGKEIIVLDANLSTPNVGLHLGSPVVPITLHDALKGKNNIREAAYLHPSGLRVVPARISLDELNSVPPDRMYSVLRDLHGTSDIVIIDAAAGLGEETMSAVRAADELIVVTNPELPAVTDALKMIRLAESHDIPILGVVVNRFRGDKLDMTLDNIHHILEKPILGVIPEDHFIRRAAALKHPVVFTHPKAHSAVGYKRVAANILGEHYAERSEKREKESMFNYMMKMLGFSR